MKKIVFLLISIVLISNLSACGWTKKQANENNNSNELLPDNIIVPSMQGEEFEKSKKSVGNYLNYKYSKEELNKITKSEEGALYFYAADGKRYVFPNIDIFKSWFGEQNLDRFKIENLETLYETPLGGNVTLRPGTLMMTETDPKIYFITGNGQMKIFGNLTLLEKLYGKNYNELIVEIPNFYFTQYKNIGSINYPEEIPLILANITIDQDKGF